MRTPPGRRQACAQETAHQLYDLGLTMTQPATRAMHASTHKDKTFNSVMTPLYPSSTFYFDKIGENKGFDYSRSGNPTRKALEETLAALEGGTACVCTATG